MNEASKLILSAEELQLVADTGFILTKHRIIDKVNLLLGNHAAFAQQYTATLNLPEAIKKTTPKIAKGENYLQLPWLLLDYPRLFEKENIFAIRTMFWWGNFFSCTLQLSGIYKKHYEAAILKNICNLPQQQFFICINENGWQHHFDATNYTALHTLNKADIEKIITEKKFIKIACRFSLQQWTQLPHLLQQSFITLLKLVEN
jgi:hypothetical protein